jgi:hypothetical protein
MSTLSLTWGLTSSSTVVGGGVPGKAGGIDHVIMIGVGFIIDISQIFIMISTPVGGNTTEIVIGMGIGGNINGFLITIFKRVGEAGRIIAIGKEKKNGMSKDITPLPHKRDRK